MVELFVARLPLDAGAVTGPIPLVAKSEAPHAGRGHTVSWQEVESPGWITPCLDMELASPTLKTDGLR